MQTSNLTSFLPSDAVWGLFREELPQIKVYELPTDTSSFVSSVDFVLDELDIGRRYVGLKAGENQNKARALNDVENDGKVLLGNRRM